MGRPQDVTLRRPQDIIFQRPKDVGRGRPQEVGRGRPLVLHRGPYGDIIRRSSGRNFAERVVSLIFSKIVKHLILFVCSNQLLLIYNDF